MRGNPGGYLNQAIFTSNLFLKQGNPILSVRARTGEVESYSATDAPHQPSIPLVVLIDGHTASASEIVAGALQDHDRALIVGTTSFGKGLVQTLFKLDGGYALKMTTAKWYTPSGRSIQKERKLLPDGEFVEVMPDSLETDSVKRRVRSSSPTLAASSTAAAASRPTVIVRPDTLTTAEQKLVQSLAPKQQIFAAAAAGLRGRAEGQGSVHVHRDAADAPRVHCADPCEGRDRRFNAARVGRYRDRSDHRHSHHGARIRRLVGEAQVSVGEDTQLMKAIDVLKTASTQQQLFAMAHSQDGGEQVVTRGNRSDCEWRCHAVRGVSRYWRLSRSCTHCTSVTLFSFRSSSRSSSTSC